MTRKIRLLLLAVLLLSACVPPTPPPVSTQPVTEPPPIPADQPTQNPALIPSCASIVHLANDSPESQQILDEMIANFEREQPTEYMGMAILHAIDRLGDWALIQGSVSGEGKDVIAVRRTPQGWQIAERYIITAPLASFDNSETIVPDYFLEKLPQAPAALFTCLDQSWLLDRPPVETPAAIPQAPASGQLAYLSHTEERMQLQTIRADGSERTQRFNEPLVVIGLTASPDGKQIAFAACRGTFSSDCFQGENFDIMAVDWEGGTIRNLTDSPGEDMYPDWSPDGRIVFSSSRLGRMQIYVMNADGSRPLALTDDGGQNTEPKWSPDGKWIAYHCKRGLETRICVITPDGATAGEPIIGTTPVWSPVGPEGDARLAFLCFLPDKSSDVCTARPDGSDLRNLTRSSADEHSLAWSPDGKWLAFVSNRGDDVDIYKVCADCPEGTPAIRLTDEPRAAGWPAWSPDGLWLAYESAGSLLLVRPDRTGVTFLVDSVSSPFIWRPGIQ